MTPHKRGFLYSTIRAHWITTMNQVCFCHSEKLFCKCCGPFLNQHAYPETPEQLMRSRYSAFCMENADYLIKTQHSRYYTEHVKRELEHTFSQSKWLGLRVIKTSGATVEFCAFFLNQGQAKIEQLHECSSFEQLEGKWVYTEGDTLKPLTLKRNDACICGSGKKIKKCCAKD